MDGQQLFALIPLALGTVTLAVRIPQLRRALRSRDWPTADGEIITSHVNKHVSYNEQQTTYRPVVRYRYTVDGRELTGKRIEFGTDNLASLGSSAENIVRNYPIGARLAVRYDPADPQTAVLTPGVSIGLVMWMALGAFFLILGAVMLVWSP